MSTQKGNGSRTRAQKHKNRTVFKNDLHDKTPQQIKLNNMHVSTVCQHCKDVIEWKIKYKKYKPLSQAKTCTGCSKRNVLKAYHVLCKDCARETRKCAKCLKSADEVEIEPPRPTPQEEQQLKTEMDRLIKSFPERKRRAFLRYMNKGKKDPTEEENEEETREVDDQTENKEKQRIPHTRDELLQKIEELKLADDEKDDYDFGSDDDDDEGVDSNNAQDDEDDEDDDEYSS